MGARKIRARPLKFFGKKENIQNISFGPQVLGLGFWDRAKLSQIFRAFLGPTWPEMDLGSGRVIGNSGLALRTLHDLQLSSSNILTLACLSFWFIVAEWNHHFLLFVPRLPTN